MDLNIKSSVFLIALFFLGYNSLSQSISELKTTIDPIFEEFRLPGENLGNAVQKIVQDSIGFLWFGSQIGLHRYDGKSIKTFRHEPGNTNSLLNNYIEDLCVDRNGKLWMTHYSHGGITCYDPNKDRFTRYRYDPNNPDGLVSNNTHVIAQDNEGFIWIGTENGLSRMDPKNGKCKNFRHKLDDTTSLSCDFIRDIYVDKKGVIWIGTGFPFDLNDECGGLNKYDSVNQSFVRYLFASSQVAKKKYHKTRGILEDSNGNLWVGTTGNDLYLFDQKKNNFHCVTTDMVNYPYFASAWSKVKIKTPTSHVTSISEDMSGKIWISLYNSGLMIFDPVKQTCHFMETRSKIEGKISTSNIWQLFQARDGSLWLCTAGSGMKVYKLTSLTNNFSFFNLKPYNIDFKNVDITFITDDLDGNIWIGTYSQEYPLIQISPSSNYKTEVKKVRWPPNIPAKYVYTLHVDKSGDLWIGTDKGIIRRKRYLGKFDHFLKQLNFSAITSIISDKYGFLWVSDYESGIYRLNPKVQTNQQSNGKNLSSIEVEKVSGLTAQCVHEDSKGQIWVGGGGGNDINNPLFIDRFNPRDKTFISFIHEKEATGGVEMVSDNKYLYFTNKLNNIQRLDLNSGIRNIIFTIPEFDNALCDGKALRLNKDESGRLWLFNKGRLIKFNPYQKNYIIFGNNFGIHKIGKTNCNLFRSDKNHLMIAGENGIISFDPSITQTDHLNTPSKMIISGMKINNEEIVFNGSSDKILSKPLWETDLVKLNHTQNTFSFSLACFDFFDPSNIVFEYMLEGIDKTGWRREFYGSQTVTYHKLPPGAYNFKVKGSNSYGIENADILSLQIVIKPPLWNTTWAYLFYLIAILTSIWSYIRYKSKAIRKQNEILETQVKLRTSELNKTLDHLKHTQNLLIQKEKLASLGELTAGIAHEIQNPLNFVNNFSEVSNELIDEVLAEQSKEKGARSEDLDFEILTDIKENLTKINHHGKRASDIVKGMLEHSRASTGKKELTDINTLCGEYLNLAFQSWRAKNKDFEINTETYFDINLPKIEIVPKDIGRVILNIINNAFYACAERSLSAVDKRSKNVDGANGKKMESDYIPTVSITTQLTANDQLIITVKDNGTGIPDHIKEKIFQPFFTTKPAGQGIGLGLSLSYDIIKAHGGDIKVSSELGQSTIFTISLPLQTED